MHPQPGLGIPSTFQPNVSRNKALLQHGAPSPCCHSACGPHLRHRERPMRQAGNVKPGDGGRHVPSLHSRLAYAQHRQRREHPVVNEGPLPQACSHDAQSVGHVSLMLGTDGAAARVEDGHTSNSTNAAHGTCAAQHVLACQQLTVQQCSTDQGSYKASDACCQPKPWRAALPLMHQ